MHLTFFSLIWLLTGVVLFIFEIFLPGFVLFFFAIGAWITAVASWLLPIGLSGQLALFLVSSLPSPLVLRGLIRKTFLGTRLAEDGGDSALARSGEKAVVVTAIEPPAEGKVRYSGTTWRATAPERIAVGEIAIIVAQDGLVMRVRKQEQEGK
jgi:membrane protein implicated in regulation of membrane protease activity